MLHCSVYHILEEAGWQMRWLVSFGVRMPSADHGFPPYCVYSLLLVATGTWVPNVVSFTGSEYVEGYETVSINPEDFAGQTVLILGRGNSAFETAENILGVTNFIHMVSRSRVRLSWATHYVGDLRYEAVLLSSSNGNIYGVKLLWVDETGGIDAEDSEIGNRIEGLSPLGLWFKSKPDLRLLEVISK